MFNFIKRYFLLVTLLFWLVGCANLKSDESSPLLVQLDNVSTGASQTQPAIVEINGQAALLYANKENRVVFQYGKQRLLLDQTAPVQGGNRFQLNFQNQNLQALWWSHENEKNLYYTSSSDVGQQFSPVSIVNDSHGVLPPFNILFGGKGVVGATYLDERRPPYRVYFNRSTDDGRTWARPDQRLDLSAPEGQTSRVLEPKSVESGKTWASVWVDAGTVAGSPRYRIMMSRSEDLGLNWLPPAVLHTSDKEISSLVVKAQGAKIVIAAGESERGIIAVVSLDHGSNWRNAGALAGTDFHANDDGASNNGIDLALAEDRAHLVWVHERPNQKSRIMRGSLNMAQAKWQDSSQRLDIKSYDNTSSTRPSIMTLPNGLIVSAWLDYRHIRSSIYLSASSDQGQVWSAPQALIRQSEETVGLPRLVPWQDQAAIAYEVYPAERISQGKFEVRRIPFGKDAMSLMDVKAPSTISEAARKTRLEQRIKMLWENRISGNHEAAYDIVDFAYRADTPLKNYLETASVITYHGFTMGDLIIAGNEAKVKMKLKYEVKPTVLASGKSITVAPMEVDVSNTWVWVNNDWYVVYLPSIGLPNLKY